MGERMADPYEQQLLAVFNSCDTERRGSLDRNGLSQLCDQLQLEEQGVKLVECLLNGSAGSVTFVDFRDGLLALLDEDGQGSSRGGTNAEDLGEQEVSPKFVFGTKKYGRKTRPKDADSVSPDDSPTVETASASGYMIDLNKKPSVDTSNISNAQHPKKRKTSLGRDAKKENLEFTSQTDDSGTKIGMVLRMDESPPKWMNNNDSEVECLRNVWDRLGVGRDGFLDRTELAKVCDHIGLEKVAEEVVKEVFDTLDSDQDNHISFNEFLLLFRSGGRLNESQSQSSPSTNSKESEKQMLSTSGDRQAHLSSADDNSYFWSLDCNGDGFASSEFILEVWERNGVQDGVTLLHNLGFTKSQVKIEELLDTLNSELSVLQAESESTALSETLLQAALSLCQTEARHLKSSLEQVYNERDKLRYDIAEANERASLLAQEVDDHHSQMEKSNKAHIKSLEQKHLDNIKQLSEQLSQERDCLSQKNQVLQGRLLDLEDLETQMRSEMAKSIAENTALYVENQSLGEQLEKVECAYATAQKELDALENLRQGFQELELNNDNEKVRSLLDKLSDMQSENTKLRDRNDELTMKVEAMMSELNTISLKKTAAQFCETRCDVCPTEQDYIGQTCDRADDLLVSGGAIKRRGDPPQNQLPFEESTEEESPRLEKIGRFCSTPRAIDISGMQIRTLTPGGEVVDLMLSLDDKTPYSITDPPLDLSKTASSILSYSSPETETDSSDQSKSSLISALRSQIDALQDQVKTLTEKLAVFEDENSHQTRENLKRTNKFSSLKSTNSVIQILEECKTKEHNNCDNTKEELEQQCRNLKSQLDEVKVEIVKILSERNACSKENCALKTHISDLKTNVGKSVSGGENANSLTPEKELGNGNRDDHWTVPRQVEQVDLVENETILNGSSLKLKTNSTEPCQNENDATLSLKSEFLEKLSVIEENHTKEKIELFERCTDLESSIEMLRQEYEKCEDYWANKLDEERAMYDKDQKILDQKYKKILAEMKEYDEYFNKEGPCSCRSNKLDTIQENEKLEAQVTDLESECADLLKQLESERSDRERELKQLIDQLSELQSKYNGDAHCAPGETKTSSMWIMGKDLVNPNIVQHHNTSKVNTLQNTTRFTASEQDFNWKLSEGNHRDIGTQVNDETLGKNQSARTAESEFEEKTAACEKLSADIRALQQQKEELFQYIQDESSKYESEMGCGKQSCCVDLNVLQTMTTRWRQQEQRCRYLQFALKQRQRHTDTILHSTWVQHKKDISEMEIILETTQESLRQQTLTNKEQSERLARNDMIVKDLYIENAYLVATVQRLEQRCQVLAHMTTDSISV